MTAEQDPPTPPRRARAARPAPRRSKQSPLVVTLLVLIAGASVFTLVAQVWTDVLWYRQLGYVGVMRTKLITQFVLFAVAFALTAGAMAASMIFAYRQRPVYAPITFESVGTERYREALEPLRRLIVIAVPTVTGLFAGSAALNQWQEALLFFNAQPFGRKDPQFGIDVGFYVFRLPFWQFLVSMLTALLVLSLVVAAVTHYLYGGVRLSNQGPAVTKPARAHIGLLLASLLVAQGLSYWLSRYALLVADGDRITGASYTGIRAVLPARTLLAVIAVLVAGLFIYAAFRGHWRLPAMGVILMLLSGLILGGAYPAAVQQFQVGPSGLTKEPPYLQRGMDATLAAYGLEQVQRSDYDVAPVGARGGLAAEAQTAASLRILDPALVTKAFTQFEGETRYYTFPDILDVDRYTIGGKNRDTVVALRELNQAGLEEVGNRGWVNQHTVYTHGYGVVAAYGNQRQPNGSPRFFEGGVPNRGDLGTFEPRVYFGEFTKDFSIVGGPEGGAPKELDYGTTSTQASTTFAGNGGPKVSNPIVRLMYAIRFRDQNIMFTDAVNPQSQILYNRTPRDRISAVAPFLTLDGDPYPTVVNGRIKWVVDAYTTSNSYPYAQRMKLDTATADSATSTAQSVVSTTGQVNYIRNSVKAVMDAYDGSVQLYSWDSDPVLTAWEKAMPGVIRPMSEISGELMSHIRYPEDMFKVQREVLGRYHVSDTAAFYNGSDNWKVPQDPVRREAAVDTKQPPYYLTLRMPGEKTAQYTLSTSMVPAGANSTSDVLAGFLAVNSNAGSTDGKRSSTYGTLKLLLPKQAGDPVAGPGQAQSAFNNLPEFSQQRNLLDAGGSTVNLGNLLTLPVAGSFLYVQPVYVSSKSANATFPALQRILVRYGSQMGFAETLDDALNQVFQGESGANAGDANTPGSPQTPAPTQQTPQQQLKAALDAAGKAIEDSQAALQKGDFAAYGKAQAALKEAIADATAADSAISGTAPPSPSASASASASPTP